MGLFDEVKKMMGGGKNGGRDGQDKENPAVQNAMDKGEQLINDKTDNKYESQVDKGGDFVQDQVEKRMGNE
jgi:hypothetical protein